ncbi:MAG: hypothetical protein WAZ44_03300, partial [Minisyncoccia bacterium]
MTNLMKGGVKYILILVLIVGVLLPTGFVDAGVFLDQVVLGRGFSGLMTDIITNILWFVAKLMSWLMGLSGLILNSVIDLTIFKMANSIRDLTGINTAWKVIKDLMNIGFIFMLVYQAILVILSIEDVSSVRKFVFGIFLASILINFSLFFTKVIIDASNVVTIGIYNNIVVPNPGAILLTDGLSNAYMNRINLQSFYSPEGLATVTGTGQAFAYVGMSILFLVVIFVFLAVSVMFIVRYIILLALLALSPIAYMGLAWKGMKKHADKWWESFWGQIIWPPVYMIMTWVVLTIMGDQGFLGNTSLGYDNLAKTTDGIAAQGAASVIVNFALVIGLTIASIVISKQFATQGASQIGKFTSAATGFAGGALLGGAARIGRTTIGRYGERMAGDEDLKRRAAEGSVRARLQLAAANRASTSTFDARATRAGKTAIGQVLGQETGFGKVNEKESNFRAIREQKLKDEKKKAEALEPTKVAKEEAKAKLNVNTALGSRFKIEEDRKAEERKAYYNSDTYLNSREKADEDRIRKDVVEHDTEKVTMEAEIKIKKEKALAERAQATREMDELVAKKNSAPNEKLRAEAEREIYDKEVDPTYQNTRSRYIASAEKLERDAREKEEELFRKSEAVREKRQKIMEIDEEKKA